MNQDPFILQHKRSINPDSWLNVDINDSMGTKISRNISNIQFLTEELFSLSKDTYCTSCCAKLSTYKILKQTIY